MLFRANVLVEFLNNCKEKLGVSFLQNAKIHTPWYLAFRGMVVREKELEKNKNRLAIIHRDEIKNITVTANSTVTIQGVTAKELDH